MHCSEPSESSNPCEIRETRVAIFRSFTGFAVVSPSIAITVGSYPLPMSQEDSDLFQWIHHDPFTCNVTADGLTLNVSLGLLGSLLTIGRGPAHQLEDPPTQHPGNLSQSKSPPRCQLHHQSSYSSCTLTAPHLLHIQHLKHLHQHQLHL